MSAATPAVNPATKSDAGKDLVFSYLTLRNLIGLCGMLVPVVFIVTALLTGEKFEPSISDFYYTNTGDVLVVMLCIIGVFLFTYNGYNRTEKFCTNLAALCGIGVAFSPTRTRYLYPNSVHSANDTVPLIFNMERHLWFAVTFFIVLGIMSWSFFPKSDQASHRKADGTLTQKGKRNILYKVCGGVMFGCVIILAAYFVCKPIQALAGNFPFIFTFESIALWAFGISWLTKGETLWPDHDDDRKTTYGTATGNG